jgi:ABC-type multidrug transport system fused ATPase/permease subunit
MARVQIKTSPGKGEILIDGELLRGVTAFELRGSVGQPERLTVELLMLHGGEIETNAAVKIPDKTRDSLMRLGWTPPKDADH